MKAFPVYNADNLSKVLGDIRAAFMTHGRIRVTIHTGRSRSLDQNALSHAWYQQVADELREDSERDVKRFCKLHFGVPILRAEDDEFRAVYDGALRHSLSYEQKLQAMDVLPVTSRMTTAQLSQYLETMQTHYAQHGVALAFPMEAAA